MPQTRTADEIRASIEQNREELGASLERLRGEVVRLTDWRSQLRRHQSQAMIAAGVVGFVLGGGIAGLTAVLSGGRRDRSARGRGRG
jgi:hypothetical protein